MAALGVDDAGAALRRWFGPAAAAKLLLDGDAMRDALDRDIAAIDALLSEQVDAILHAPRLRKLEGSWRGLAWLVGGLEPAGRVKVRMLSIAWWEICRDLERAVEFDHGVRFPVRRSSHQRFVGEAGVFAAEVVAQWRQKAAARPGTRPNRAQTKRPARGRPFQTANAETQYLATTGPPKR